jgi:hypothetical protein
MILSKKWSAVKLLSPLVFCTFFSISYAQDGFEDPNVGYKYNQKTIRNQYPCAECAVYDNNGNDLRGFINTTKKDLVIKGAKVNEASNNTWGYLEIKNAKIPSVSKKGDLDYTQSFDITLGMYEATGGEKATWWGRECNAPKGALVYIKTEDKDKLSLDNVKYSEMLHQFESKKITLVEYYNEPYNQNDYDFLFKNYILMPAGSVKDANGYKNVVDFYNGFLNKFSSVNDPLVENKSFITCFSINNVKYLGYFNIVNSKLAGKLEIADIQYDRDRDTVINRTFKMLTGKTVFVYGDDIFGMEKKIISYGRKNNIKLVRRKTSDSRFFNDEK